MDAGIIDNDFNGMPDGMEPMVKMNWGYRIDNNRHYCAH